MSFSKEEFDIMVDELLYREPMSFDMLCNIANKALKGKIALWCANDDSLRGRGYEDDILQSVQERLMRTAISGFLLRDGVNGGVNADPKGFYNWMKAVAINIKRDYAKKVRGIDFNTVPIEGADIASPGPENEDEKLERLRVAFSIVLSADVNIYKVLTWLAQFVCVIEFGITKKESNNIIVEVFKDKTLFEMYEILLKMSEKIEWIEITESQHERIVRALNKKRINGTLYGFARYEEFFMKLNGKKSGKKSISDWVNRLNNMIREKQGKKNNKSEEGH